MSRQNVERLRQAAEAFNGGDRTAFLALCDPEVENIPPRDWPESEPIRGREAVWDFYIETTSLWDKRSVEYAVNQSSLAQKGGAVPSSVGSRYMLGSHTYCSR